MTPTVFISYSWDSEEHKKWVRTLADRLEEAGVTVTIDDRDFALGDHIPKSMERGISQNDFVLFICTPRYAERSNKREGGVGYETNIMTAEIAKEGNDRKFIPIWRSGDDWHKAAPSWAHGKKYADLRDGSYYNDEYAKLLQHLRNEQYLTSPAEHQETLQLDIATVRGTENREHQRKYIDIIAVGLPSHVMPRLWHSTAARILSIAGVVTILGLVVALTRLWDSGDLATITMPTATPQVIAAGQEHACGIKLDNTVECWGKLGDGRSPPPGMKFTQVSAGVVHTCGVKTDGAIWCGGHDLFGGADPPTGTVFVQVSAGNNNSNDTHACAVTTDGDVKCWGASRGFPPAGARFVHVGAGATHTCAVTENGEVLCWGDDQHGATDAPSNAVFTQVGAGRFYTCGLTTDGYVRCWGDDEYGKSSPPEDLRFKQLSVGSEHACGVTTSGDIRCWGSHGAVQVPSEPDLRFAQVSAGLGYTCAVTIDGVAQCWAGWDSHDPPPPLGLELIPIDSLP